MKAQASKIDNNSEKKRTIDEHVGPILKPLSKDSPNRYSHTYIPNNMNDTPNNTLTNIHIYIYNMLFTVEFSQTWPICNLNVHGGNGAHQEISRSRKHSVQALRIRDVFAGSCGKRYARIERYRLRNRPPLRTIDDGTLLPNDKTSSISNWSSLYPPVECNNTLAEQTGLHEN